MLQIYQSEASRLTNKWAELCCCLFTPMNRQKGLQLNINEKQWYIPPQISSSSVLARLFANLLAWNRDRTSQNDNIGTPEISVRSHANYVLSLIDTTNACNAGTCVGDITCQKQMQTEMYHNSCCRPFKPENVTMYSQRERYTAMVVAHLDQQQLIPRITSKNLLPPLMYKNRWRWFVVVRKEL